MKRREFIQTGALAVAGTLALPSVTLAADRKIGLQLYTIRDIIGKDKDTKGILKQVADLGYKEIETFGYSDGMLFGMKAKEFGDYIKSLGMKVVSGHYQLGKTEKLKAMKGTILNDWERAVADAKETGQEYMAVAYLNADERKTLDDYKFVIDNMNKAGEVCKKYNVRLQYHNHDFELEKIDGQIPYDLMLAQLDPKLVSMEMDLFWVIFAGYQPTEYFKKYPGRFEQWHVKDMDKTDKKKNANIGTGAIDFKPIFAQAAVAGMKHFYVEHDNVPKTSMESITADIAYAKTL
jgi:sugar phosphate isomerase/epimerase